MAAEENADCSANSRLFADLDAKTLTTLGERTVRRPLKKGRTIFYQGDPGDTLFVSPRGS